MRPLPHAHILFSDGSRASLALDSLEILAGTVRPQRMAYRLVYRVEEDALFVTVIAVGKRDKNQVYQAAQGRT